MLCVLPLLPDIKQLGFGVDEFGVDAGDGVGEALFPCCHEVGGDRLDGAAAYFDGVVQDGRCDGQVLCVPVVWVSDCKVRRRVVHRRIRI